MPIFLRDPADTSGKLRQFDDEEDARRAIVDFGWQEASPDEVQARTQQREYGGAGGQARAFLNSAAAGTFDAAVAPVRLLSTAAGAAAGALGAEGAASELDAFNEQISGRKFLENLNAVATELAGGGNAEAAARQYDTESRALAQANPWASTTGYLGGQVLGSFGVAGASRELGKAAASAATSRALGMVTEGAAEGALLSPGQAGEDAWIKNEKLTSEQLMGAIGWGTLLGGGAGGALYGTGAIYRAGKGAAGRAAEAAGDKLGSVFAGPKTSASAEQVAEVASGALGAPVTKAEGSKIKQWLESARDRIEQGQAAATGADLETIQKYGPLRWDNEAMSGRELADRRDEIVEAAKGDFNSHLQKLSDSTEPVIDEVRFAGLKREHVASAIGENKIAQLAEARTQAQAVESMLVPMRRPGSAAKAARDAVADAPIERDAYLATFAPEQASAIDDELDDEIRDALDALGKKTDEGTRAWKRVEQDVLRERVARQTPMDAPIDPREGALRGELGNAGVLDEVERYASRHLSAIAKTEDPVEAFMQLDSLKRGMQKYADRTGKSARALLGTSPERAAGMRKVSDLIERFQEPVRVSLENEAVWGKAASNQRAINAALTRYIESNKVFQARYMRETVGYRGLGVTRSPREEATAAFLDKMGLAQNAPAEQHLRAHLRATTDVLSALDGALDIGEKKALVSQAIATERGLTGTLDSLDRTVKVANKIRALERASSDDNGAAKTIIGSLIGGPVGAVAGYGLNVLQNPGRMMRTAVGLQRLAKRYDVKLDQAIDGVFGKAAGAAKKAENAEARAAAAAAVDPAAPPANDIAPDVAPDVFPDEVSEVRARPKAAGSKQGAALPAALAVFLGNHEDKQLAFKARAQEIHDATADMGEKVRAVVGSDMAEVSEDFPGFTGSLAAGMTRAALFLESKLPRSYRAAAPGAIGRSAGAVADHDIAKFARYWSAVHDPTSVLHDMALGTVSSEQIEAVKAVYPELWLSLSERLLGRAAELDAKGTRLPLQTRMQLGRFVGVPIEPAFRSSVLDILDQARQGQGQAQAQGMNTGAPLQLTTGAAPESVQIQQRAGRVG